MYSKTPFQILYGMFNSFDAAQYPRFQETNDKCCVVVKDILDSSDLEQLSQEYDDLFLVPMRAKGRRPRSRGQEQENESDSSSNNTI